MNPALPLELARARRDVEAASPIGGRDRMVEGCRLLGLVEAGFGALSRPAQKI